MLGLGPGSTSVSLPVGGDSKPCESGDESVCEAGEPTGTGPEPVIQCRTLLPRPSPDRKKTTRHIADRAARQTTPMARVSRRIPVTATDSTRPPPGQPPASHPSPPQKNTRELHQRPCSRRLFLLSLFFRSCSFLLSAYLARSLSTCLVRLRTQGQPPLLSVLPSVNLPVGSYLKPRLFPCARGRGSPRLPLLHHSHYPSSR